MSWLGSGYYEEGDVDSPDIVLFGVNPFDELNDAQRTVHEFGHDAEAHDTPVLYPKYKGKVVKGVREFGVAQRKRLERGVLGRREKEQMRREMEYERGGEEEQQMTEEDILEQALEEMPPGGPPLPPRDIAEHVGSAEKIAKTISSIGDFKGYFTHANIGVRIEDLTPKEMRALDLYVARAIRLWLKLRGKKRFVRKTLGGIKLKRGEIFGKEEEREERRRKKHSEALDLLRRYRERQQSVRGSVPELPERDIASSNKAYEHFYNAMGDDSSLHTSSKGNVKDEIYHIGLGQRMYTTLYEMDDDSYKEREIEALNHFEQEYGLPFEKYGSPRDEEDAAKGTLCLFPGNDKKQEPYAIFSNYLLNPKYTNKVTIASSSLGQGLKGKQVTEAGWMVTIKNKDGVALKGEYNKIAPNNSKIFFSDVHISTKGTSSVGDEGFVGSPINIHLESKKPSVPSSDDGLDDHIDFVVGRVVDNGHTLGVSIKSANRDVEVKGGMVTITSKYVL